MDLIHKFQTSDKISPITTSGNGYIPSTWIYNPQTGQYESVFNKLFENNTINEINSSGIALYVNFPEHKIGLDGGGNLAEGLSKLLNIDYIPFIQGHAGIITIAPNGYTGYYQYGRYSDKSTYNIGITTKTDGNFQKIPIKNMDVKFDYQNFVDYLSQKFKEPAEIVVVPNVDHAKIIEYINQTANDKKRSDYSILNNNCGTQAVNAIKAGKPSLNIGFTDITPTQIVNSLISQGYKRYKSKNNTK